MRCVCVVCCVLCVECCVLCVACCVLCVRCVLCVVPALLCTVVHLFPDSLLLCHAVPAGLRCSPRHGGRGEEALLRRHRPRLRRPPARQPVSRRRRTRTRNQQHTHTHTHTHTYTQSHSLSQSQSQSQSCLVRWLLCCLRCCVCFTSGLCRAICCAVSASVSVSVFVSVSVLIQLPSGPFSLLTVCSGKGWTSLSFLCACVFVLRMRMRAFRVV